MSRVFLTGLQGSGKTFLGNAVAARYGIKQYDTDQEFNSRTNLTISQFVSAYKTFRGGLQKGWLIFRELESEIVEELCNKTPEDAIISLGGGVIAHDQGESFRQANIRNIKATGAPIIYLSPFSDPVKSAMVLTERKIKDLVGRENRPDLIVGPESEYEKMRQLAIKRDPIYLENSTVVLYTATLEDEDKIELIAKLGDWKK